MASNTPLPLTRDLLRRIYNDQRFITFMEQLADIIPSVTTGLEGSLEELRIEVESAISQSQQAISQIPKKMAIGSFIRTTDQAASAINTPTAVVFDTTVIANGVSLNSSQITVTKTGKYKIEFRVQI